MKQVSLSLLLLFFASASFACDLTLQPGGDIQAAINSLSSAGGKICLSPGSFSTSNLTINKNHVTIQGAGRGETHVFASGGSRGIRVNGSNITLNRFSLIGEGGDRASRTFGILVYNTHSANIWTLDVSEFKISIGVVESTNVGLSNIWADNNGDPYNESAGGTTGSDPHLWITYSNDVNINWGTYTGQADGIKPGGDGELAVYDSTNVHIFSTHVRYSGASGIYMVNCDSCSIANSRISTSDGWGIDVVGGSSSFSASGNRVYNSRYGAVVYHEHVNGHGIFTDNTFFGPNNPTGVGACAAINVRGDVENLTLSGNVNYDSGPIACERNW